MSDAWMEALAEVEDRPVEDRPGPTEEVPTEPATSPRVLEQTVAAELPVQERPVFRQPPPPPRADRPHRTTQQWLRQQPEDEELRNRIEQDHLDHQRDIAQWEEQMQMQAQLSNHPKLLPNPCPTTVHRVNFTLVQHQTFMQLCEKLEHDPAFRPSSTTQVPWKKPPL